MKSKLKGVLGIGLAIVVTLALGMVALPNQAKADPGTLEWTRTGTPTTYYNQLAPDTDLYDMAIGPDGDTVYVIGYDFNLGEVRLWKSVNGGETWTDYTAAVQDAVGLPADFGWFANIAVAPDDDDFVVVAGYLTDRTAAVVASKDGANNFTYTGDMVDTSITPNSTLDTVYDMDVALEVGGVHNIAVAGQNNGGNGCVFRLAAGTWLSAAWEDTTAYLGWVPLTDGSITSVEFSPNFDMDCAIVTLGDDGTNYYLQSGTWEAVGGMWNEEAGFPAGGVRIEDTGNPISSPWRGFGATGIALPSDYDGTNPATVVNFVFVNGDNPTVSKPGGWVFRIDYGDVSPRCNPSGNPYLHSIDYYGTGDSGKAMVGKYGDTDDPTWCSDVQVYRTAELDVCCPRWYAACKPPTGWDGEVGLALVMYTADGEKAYAVTWGYESAFSVSVDDGDSWNQFGLIDTMIDCLGDVQVTADCEKAYITSTNLDYGWYDGEAWHYCDSVWRSQIDDHGAIGQFWERVLCTPFSEGCCCGEGDPGLLRLPVDQEHPEAVYLGDYDSDNMYYSLDQGQCWGKTPPTKVDIQDFAVENESTIYVLGANGTVSMSDAYGRHWTLPVDTLIGDGHSITCMPEGNVLVGSTGTATAYSDDGAATFSLLPDLPITGKIHLAWAPLCTDTIFAAISGASGGIYRIVIGDALWTDLNAKDYDYYGIVLGKSDGTLYAATDQISVLGGEIVAAGTVGAEVYSGVARCLDPCETACCDVEVWDYLHVGLGDGPTEEFTCEPSALRICGCLTADTDSTLWAIDCCAPDGDETGYDMAYGLRGALWEYTDCLAKVGPTLVSPADGDVLACDPCACQNAPFTLKWERLCLSCSYDIVLMDADGNVIKYWAEYDPVAAGGRGAAPSLYVVPGIITECAADYQWMVRVVDAETTEWIKSPWSEIWSFTIEAGIAGPLTLLTPSAGATSIMTSNIPFSWTAVPNVTSYVFVLSANADLSSPLAETELTGTSYAYTGTLDYEASYFWQVTAMKDGTVLAISNVGAFTIEEAPPAPPAPPPAEPEPTWPPYAWAIIAIGAALMVVVIVLIYRTRRVP